MSYTIKLWDLWVRLEKRINAFLAPRVRRILQAREVAKADKFLKEWRRRRYSEETSTFWLPLTYKDPKTKCNHTKGGGGRSRHYRPGGTDYNLMQHTFVDGRTKIWCGYNCGLVAWNGDKNFDNLVKMTERSSNRASSSERTVLIAQSLVSVEPVVTVQDRIPDGD